jgi:hypothetical protein
MMNPALRQPVLEEALATANAWEKHQIAGLLPEKRRWNGSQQNWNFSADKAPKLAAMTPRPRK